MSRTLLVFVVFFAAFAESLISSKSAVCVKNDSNLFNSTTCQNRLHTNVQVTYQGINEKYIFRSQENNDDIIVSLEGDSTQLVYDLDYHLDVPFYYVEKNIDFTWNGEGSHCYSSCTDAPLEGCSVAKDLPKSSAETFPLGICCQCGKNASQSSHRANFSCSTFSEAFQSNICMSKSCLKVMNPWYSLSSVVYPPRYIRNLNVTIQKIGESDDIFKCKINDDQRLCRDEKHDISITLKSSKSQDGQEAPLIDSYILIPSFPAENPKVISSSIKNNCGLTEEEAKNTQFLGKKCLEMAINVDKDAVDITGTTCDKIGVSPSYWGNERRLCNSPKYTCTNNQLGWYIKEYPKRVKLPKVYGAMPIAHIKAIDSGKDDNEMIRAISYIIDKPHVSTILIDTIQGSFIEIQQFSNAKIAFAKFSHCNDINKCFVDVGILNAEESMSHVYLSVKCTDNDHHDVILGESEQIYIQAEPVNTSTRKVSISISNYKDVQGTCQVVIMSPKMDIVDKIDFPISLKIPKKNIGPNSQSFDSYTIPKVETEAEAEPDGKKVCSCNWYNAICYFSNFSTCIWGGFTEIYKTIIFICAILLILLFIPFIIALIKRIRRT